MIFKNSKNKEGSQNKLQKVNADDNSLRRHYKYTIATLDADKVSRKGVERWSFQEESDNEKNNEGK
ncbi:hypothetical protein BKI52_02560 [marine bacterium AO1-C]|nr:hypothetical protein BKI52_02560 [marine bacterium AO1-C]